MKRYILSAIFVMAVMTLNAQKTSIQDTVYSIDEVTVMALSAKKAKVMELNVPLKYLPVSVNLVSAKTLEMRGIVNLQDAVKFLPGVRMRTTYGSYQQLAVRGFDYTPIMIDGIRDERTSINNSAPFPDLSSVESIEMLKGPASVLYGHSAVGGILNVVRKAPTARRTVEARMSYGSWNNKQATMGLGGNIYKSLNFRAIVNWSDNEGYRYTNDKRFSGYIALGAKLSDKQTIDIRGGFNRDKYGTEIGLAPNMSNDVYNTDGSLYLSKGQMQPNLNRRWRYNNESDFMINNGSNIMVKYRYEFSEKFKLENRLSYSYDNIDYFSTESLNYRESSSPIYDHYYMKAGKKQYIDLDTLELKSPLRFAYTMNVINEQLEFSGKLNLGSIKYNYLAGYNFVGMYRDRYRGYNLGVDVVGPGLNSKVPVHNPHSMGYMETSFSSAIVNRTFTHSVYLQNLLELSDQFKVMLAGRYDYFDYWNAPAQIVDGKRKYTDREPFQKVNNSAFTYRVGAVYLPVSSLSIYGSMANFFSPYRDFINPNAIYIGSDGKEFFPKDGDEIFKPQTGYQAELGARYTFSHLLQATGSVYYINKNNEKKTLATIVEDGKPTKTVYGQVGRSDSKGFELEVQLTPSSDYSLTMGYAYTDARIRDMKKNEYMIEEENKGKRLAGIPKNTFFTAGNYQFSEGALKNLGFNFTVSYTDNVYRTISKDVIYPSYWLTDIGVSYLLNNGVRLSVNVNNVFNEKYYNQSLGRQMVPSMPTNSLFTLAYSLR
jgi:iron complex outermembrane receptor protein